MVKIQGKTDYIFIAVKQSTVNYPEITVFHWDAVMFSHVISYLSDFRHRQ